LFYDNEPTNTIRMYEALVAFWGGDVPGVSNSKDLAQEGVIVQFGRPPNRIDLMNRVDGLSFQEAWETRLEIQIFVKETTLHVNYVSLEKLIQNKQSSGRPRDLEDLEYLRRALGRG
jgi:hypothetical protein